LRISVSKPILSSTTKKRIFKERKTRASLEPDQKILTSAKLTMITEVRGQYFNKLFRGVNEVPAKRDKIQFSTFHAPPSNYKDKWCELIRIGRNKFARHLFTI
jgi:hypothetical protein